MTEPATQEADDLEALLVFVRDSRGFDFTGYKRTTLTRRILKRMDTVGVRSFTDYMDLLETNADEFSDLFNTILINVTSFFREGVAWQRLQDDVLRDVFRELPSDTEIRLWSAGCSSGEEAYSLAMVLAEILGIPESVKRVKIYGTDVDEDALQQARAGLYGPKALEALPEGYREKYFDSSGPNFAFRADLRRRVIFGRHDLTRDAPISKLHLLTCRNTLMYFNAETQNQIIDRFHFALQPGGYLFLGRSEMLLTDGERYDAVSMRDRIFRRRDGESSAVMPIRFRRSPLDPDDVDYRSRQIASQVIEAIPAAVITLDVDDNVLMVNSLARSGLGLVSQDIGRRFADLQISYRPLELRSLLERVKEERRSFQVDSVELHPRGEGSSRFFEIVVQPLAVGENLVGTAIVFIDATRRQVVEDELRTTLENLETVSAELQSSNEELETTNEELQSSIEELETTNEELQSTNEELETTNEELQSSNEELETMNEEMRIRTSEMEDARSFLESVFDSVGASIVALDHDEDVLIWNRGSEEMWGLRAEEVVGLPFFTIDFGLPTELLRELVHSSLLSREAADPIEIRAINRLGQGILCRVSASPLEDAQGVVLVVEAIGREATPANGEASEA